MKLTKAVAAIVALCVLGGLGYALLAESGEGRAGESLQIVPVRRGDLVLSIVAGGSLQAMKSEVLRNETIVPTGDYKNAILEIVPEGTVITEEDVKDGKVLVRFDSSGIEPMRDQLRITVAQAEAQVVQSVENLAMQEKQNESDIALARLRVKFARMDLERYLGVPLAAEVLEKGLEEVGLEAVADVWVRRALGAELVDELFCQGAATSPAPQGLPPIAGSASKALNDLAASVRLARAQLSQATEQRRWSEQLAAKQYITREELMRDQLEEQRAKLALDAAVEALELFKRYTLLKTAKTLYSNYQEAKRALERVQAQARSRIAQAQAWLESARASYELQKRRLDQMNGWIAKCTIRATTPGRIVYASTVEAWRRQNEPIEVGRRLWPLQSVILIPDMSTLAARVNIQESDIAKVQVGQKALVWVEAVPDRPFTATVKRISPVASSANFYVSPDVRVYETDVALDEPSPGLACGMSATAQIVTGVLKDVLYVPAEALTNCAGRTVCVVQTPGGPEVRNVQTGKATDMFMEIKSGLKEGEPVYLHPERLLARGEGG